MNTAKGVCQEGDSGLINASFGDAKATPVPAEEPVVSPKAADVLELSALTVPQVLRTETAQQSPEPKPDKAINKISLEKEAVKEALQKLFEHRPDGEAKFVYDAELSALAAKLKISAEELLSSALGELEQAEHKIEFDPKSGELKSSEKVGENFRALYKLASSKVDIFYLTTESLAAGSSVPLSSPNKTALRAITDFGQVGIMFLVKEPPESAAVEIRKIADKDFKGLISLMTHAEFVQNVEMSETLRSYLRHATVRLMVTGSNHEVSRVAKEVNESLEKKGNFESDYWIKIVKGVSQSEKHESLKDILKVSLPIVFGVKILEKYAPGALHVIGGALDDLFGAILPDVSQSMGRKGLSFKEKFKEAWPVLKGGLISLPVAVGLGWFSTLLYSEAAPLSVRMTAGVCFALACSLGSVGTSIAAFHKAYKALGEVSNDDRFSGELKKLSTWEKCKLAFRESILDIPFRIGHTVLGVPLQIGLGAAAGAFNFFHNPMFVAVEGMLETILGAGTAFLYPKIANWANRNKLRAEPSMA